MSVVLIGPPGTGKTASGRIVAERLTWLFIDADSEIEAQSGMTIAEMFRRHGESYFRTIERSFLQELVSKHACSRSPIVLATGGGMPVADENWRLVNQLGDCVWLFAEPSCLLGRLGDGSGRPLLEKDTEKRLIDLLDRRAAAYARARYKIDTTGKSPFQVADEIVNLLAANG